MKRMRDIINPETVCIAFNPLWNMNEVDVSDYQFHFGEGVFIE